MWRCCGDLSAGTLKCLQECSHHSCSCQIPIYIPSDQPNKSIYKSFGQYLLLSHSYSVDSISYCWLMSNWLGISFIESWSSHKTSYLISHWCLLVTFSHHEQQSNLKEGCNYFTVLKYNSGGSRSSLIQHTLSQINSLRLKQTLEQLPRAVVWSSGKQG